VIIGMDVLGRVDTLVLDYPRARVYILPAPPPISMADACRARRIARATKMSG
jgi:hypothetical protein